MLVQLYRSLRLYVNYFHPTFKLPGKKREGSAPVKRYLPLPASLAPSRKPGRMFSGNGDTQFLAGLIRSPMSVLKSGLNSNSPSFRGQRPRD